MNKILWMCIASFGLTLSAQTVTIGSQVWMSKNLSVSAFRNGDPIIEAKTDQEWIKAGEDKQPAWCYYQNNSANGTKYGKLYNWYAINDPRGLAPNGFHVSTGSDWKALTDFLGGEAVSGKKMKKSSGWSENGNGTNSSGFGGLPAGKRSPLGDFENVGYFGFWWTPTEDYYNKEGAWCYILPYNTGFVNQKNVNKNAGISVRCVKD